MEIINVNNISKNYGKIKAIDGISFSIKKGDIVGYLGKNGSGKTTTISAMTNIIKLDSGSISILGKPNKTNYCSQLSKISIVNENNGLYENLSSENNLHFYANACGSNKKQVKEMIERLLLEFDLFERRKDKVKTFSKGMKRKLAIARALIFNPEVLILDEPFEGIDLESRNTIIKNLKECSINNGMSIFITSHVMADIEELANRIIIIKQGNLIIDEKYDNFIERAIIKQIKIKLHKINDVTSFISETKQLNCFQEIQIESDYAICKPISNDFNIYKFLANKNYNVKDVWVDKESMSDIYLRKVNL